MAMAWGSRGVSSVGDIAAESMTSFCALASTPSRRPLCAHADQLTTRHIYNDCSVRSENEIGSNDRCTETRCTSHPSPVFMADTPTPAPPEPLRSARLSPERALAWAAAAGTGVAGTRLSSLDTSLMQDLLRFDLVGGPGPGLEVLEVMAAALRHGRSLRVEMRHDASEVVWTVFPNQNLFHCPFSADQLSRLHLRRLQVERVEPARREPPALAAKATHTFALRPLLWDLALHGSRSELLPEIAGPVAYRISPAGELAALRQLEQESSLAAAVARLRLETTALSDLASWPGFDRERAQRLLNGLYLSAALMVSRTHPSALRDLTRPEPAA